ncbi:UNVERIFIED_CONTAM: hypothetical protein PYX00_003550 [Menopon gallinae]|uniref:Uncharacterized protein n=1 Tax=Menopon gallinae TaxID=328185 RepID=A0AAW2I205_9NEOP
MVIKALINKIKGPLLALDEDFKKSDKSIDDLVDETLKWFDDMEVLLNNKLGKQKNTNRKRNIRSTQVNSVNSVLDCTIATRTRAAQKAIRESQAITVSVSNNEKHNKKTRESQDQNVGELSCPKRPAEEEILIHNNSKKIKREKLSIVENETFKMPYPKGVDVKDSVEPPKPAKRTKRTATQKNEDSNKNVSKINSPKEVTKTRNSQTISQSTLILEPQTSRIFENINTISPLLKNGIPKERSSTKAQGIGSPAESRRSKISRDKANNSVDSEFNNVLPAVKCSTPKERSSRRSLCSPINKHSPVTSTVNTGIIDETMSNSMLCQAKSSTPKECFMERTYALRSPQTRKDSRKSITVIETADETISNSVVVETETCTPKKILDKICALLSSDIKPSPPRNVKANTEKKTKEESRTSDSNLKRSAPPPKLLTKKTNEEKATE